MRTRSLRQRSPLLWMVVPLAVGVVLARLGCAPPAWLALLASGLCLVPAWRSAQVPGRAWRHWFCACMVLAGVAAYQVHRKRLQAREELPPREVDLELRCERVFVSTIPGRCSLIGRVTKTDSHLGDYEGQRLYLAYKLGKGEGPPLRTQRLHVKGVLEPLVAGQGARGGFEQYLKEGGVGFRMRSCREVRRVGGPTLYAYLVECLADRMERILGAGLRERRRDLSGVYNAMLLGRASELSKEQRERYMLSGTLHLFAISGMHIAVIATALGGLLSLLPLGPGWRFGLCAALLWLYVDATGAAPSALRSYLMVLCVQGAQLGRLPGGALSGLCLALLLVLVVSPLELFGAGLQLSYGIVAALVLLGGPLNEELAERINPLRDVPALLWTRTQRVLELFREWAVPTLANSLAAGVVGLLGGVCFFGVLSHGSLLANLLMIPASVLVLYAGFVSLVLGALGLDFVAALFNFAGGFVLWGMESFIAWFVRWPGVHASVGFSKPWAAGIALAGLFMLMLAGYELRWGRRGCLLPLPFVWCVSALLLAGLGLL